MSGGKATKPVPKDYPAGWFTEPVRAWKQLQFKPNAQLLAAMERDAQRCDASAAGRASAYESNRQWNARPGQTALPGIKPNELRRRGRPRADAPVRRPPGEGTAVAAP